MSTTLLRPLGFSEILDGAFALYRRHFVTFFATALISFLPMPFLSRMLAQQAASEDASGAGLLLLMPVMLVTMMAAWAAMTWQAAQGINDRPMSVAEGFRRGLRAFLPLTGAIVIGYLLVMVAVMVLMGVLGVAAGLLFAVAGAGAGTTTVAAVGMILALVLAAALFAALFAVPPAVVVEHRGAWAALKRSWQLTRGAWMRVVGVMLVSWIIIMLPNIGLYAVGASVGLFSLAPEATPTPAWVVIEASLSYLISSLAYPFFVVATTILYFDRRVRTEGYDLEVAAESLALSH